MVITDLVGEITKNTVLDALFSGGVGLYSYSYTPNTPDDLFNALVVGGLVYCSAKAINLLPDTRDNIALRTIYDTFLPDGIPKNNRYY